MKRNIFFLILTVANICGFAQSTQNDNSKAPQTKKVVVTRKITTTTAKKDEAEKATSSKNNATKTETAKAKTNKNDSEQLECGYLCNPPLPYMPAKLDILFIGNSFSVDTSSALPEIFKSLGIHNVNVYVLYKGACSMKQHFDYYKSGEKVYELFRYNSSGEQLLEKATSINDVMCQFAYDIVVFQQYSLESGDYSTYEPYLSKLIQLYNINKVSPRTTFAFNETWAYSANNKLLQKYKTQANMWASICNSVKKMKANTGIDIIIPCGTAVQNARNIEVLDVDDDLTRDSQHMNLYAGRYLVACTFFESIIAPCLGVNLRNDKTFYGKPTDVGAVNDSNRHLLQNCARLAVANNYEISEFANQ
ncbi:MAG: DUF4886 domain-containing protein [Prevotellaceae bacterium]|nr:DUF4886 domain-containing protein [Prevotellaceae bacterium]